MKKKLTIICFLACLYACSNSKKTTVTESKTKQMAFNIKKSTDGIYEPDSTELNAIQLKYKEVTLSQLKEGYILYAYGPCVSCHNAKNIYQFDETRWQLIIDEMSISAKISASQKDAVYKYILSIKATEFISK